MYTCTINQTASPVKEGRVKRKQVDRNRVAEYAGVSSATVSRVYNHPESVSEEKRQLVLRAARTLGYRPNKSASQLRRKGTGTVMLLEFEKPQRSYYWKSLQVFNWFYADVIYGLQEVFDSSMFTLQLRRAENLQDIRHLADEADGIIGFDVDRPEEAEAVCSIGVPYVIAHHTAGYEGFHRCSTDNRRGGHIQAEYLHQQGCRRVLYLTGYLDAVYPHRERLDGFLSAAQGIGMETAVLEHVLESDLPAAQQMLGSGTFDGAAAVNDLTLLRVLQGASLQESHTIPVIGYDAMPVRDLLHAPFASVDPLPRAIYRQAGKMIMDLLSGKAEQDPRIQAVEPVLSP